MRFLSKVKDGGPESPVDAYVLFEVKWLASVILLKFNKGGRKTFHTHAFNAMTWFLYGDIVEEDLYGEKYHYRRSLIPKFTKKKKNHRVLAHKNSWCFTIRGPWSKTWTEVFVNPDTLPRTKREVMLTHGRKIVEEVVVTGVSTMGRRPDGPGL